MDPDFEFIVLRILHIVSGSFWVGAGIFLSFILEPRVRALGPVIQQPVMSTIGKITGPIMSGAGLITVVAGIILAFRTRDVDKWFVEGDGWGWAIGLGFVVSVAALIIGGCQGRSESVPAGRSKTVPVDSAA